MAAVLGSVTAAHRHYGVWYIKREAGGAEARRKLIIISFLLLARCVEFIILIPYDFTQKQFKLICYAH